MTRRTRPASGLLGGRGGSSAGTGRSQDQRNHDSRIGRKVPRIGRAQHRHQDTGQDDRRRPRHAAGGGAQAAHQLNADEQHRDGQRQRDLMRVQVAVEEREVRELMDRPDVLGADEARAAPEVEQREARVPAATAASPLASRATPPGLRRAFARRSATAGRSPVDPRRDCPGCRAATRPRTPATGTPTRARRRRGRACSARTPG